MNETLKNHWKLILGNTKIDKNYYDMVLRYIEVFILDDTLYHNVEFKSDENNYEILNDNLLPIIIEILSNIDLSKVEFINYPMNMEKIYLKIKDDDYRFEHIVNEVSQFINDKLNNGYKIQIYKVIQNIRKINGEIEIVSKMNFIKNN